MTERVLFLCTHNSARSQMAEGMLRAWAGDRYEAHSAGTEATFVWPETIQVMSELGIDISGHESKAISRYDGQQFDYAVTVCEDSSEACPYFPARHGLHWSFDDPSVAGGSAEERLAVFRKVRDEIASHVREEFAPGTS
jgi:arsenate reductase (thioredoxin)